MAAYEYSFDPDEQNNTAASVYRFASAGGSRVLDLGSGSGIVASYLATHDGKQVTCLDKSAQAVAAARAGGGCIMGSKNLKAIAVRGSGEIRIYDPKHFLEKAIDAGEALMKDVGAQSLARYGTAGITEAINENYSLP